MGRYRSMRKCKEIGEMEVMTRPRAEVTGRKRKLICGGGGGELSRSTTTRSLVQLRSRRRRLSVSTTTTPENSSEKAGSSNSNDPYVSSCCSSNGSIELENDTSKFVDLEEEEESVEIETWTFESERCGERRETTPSSSEIQVESAEMDSTAAKPSSLSSQGNHQPQSTEEKMPSEAELEEFFSKAEQNIRQQFAQKYNFDILKEEALEGRYEWVRVNP